MVSDWIARGGARKSVRGAAKIAAAGILVLAFALGAFAGESASAPAKAAATGPASAAGSGPEPAPVFTRMDSLFLAAATGEPRFRALRDSSEKILIAGGAATLDYLIARCLMDQTPRQRHYVETLFKAISDSGGNPAAAAKLGEALRILPDTLKPQLLRFGSELGDTAFLPIAYRYLDHDSEEVREQAFRSLGKYPAPGNAARLLRGLDKAPEPERIQRLWALGKQKGFREWSALLPFLKDPNLQVRELARQAAAASCGDWSEVEKLVPQGISDDELLEWILLADAAPGLAAKVWVRRQVPRLSPDRMKYIGSVLRLQ